MTGDVKPTKKSPCCPTCKEPIGDDAVAFECARCNEIGCSRCFPGYCEGEASGNDYCSEDCMEMMERDDA